MTENTTLVPTVTTEQTTLIRRTLAEGATEDELKLFLYDCARQRVHPLDRLLHFTKRGGRYTPITSIDLMRIRAAETGECLGISDPGFAGTPKGADFAATVTVRRLVQTQTAEFTATARWSEYCPAKGQDHMWQRMPHTMLGKCAEALALRKGFPKQLAGLYAREEMDQAGPESPAAIVVTRDGDAVNIETGELTDRPEPPAGTHYIERVEETPTRNKNLKRFAVTLSDGRVASTIKPQLGALAQAVAQGGYPVVVEVEEKGEWLNLVGLHRLAAQGTAPAPEMPTADDIPF